MDDKHAETPGELASAWTCWAEKSRDLIENEYYWAWEQLEHLGWDDPEAAWEVILEAVRGSRSEHVLGNIAAGPLEDLLHRHGERFVDRIEAAARSDGRFRRCLTGVWGWERMPASIRQRLESVIEKEPGP